MRSTCLVAALALAVPLSAPNAVRGQAQSGPRPTITVAATISAAPAGEAAFPINVGPPSALPHNSFVRVRGLPPMVALSDGHSISPGTWAVSLAALPALKLTLPAEAAGRSEIVITLVGINGTVLAEARSVLAIAAARPPARARSRATRLLPPSRSCAPARRCWRRATRSNAACPFRNPCRSPHPPWTKHARCSS